MNYKIYRMSVREKIQYMMMGGGGGFAICYLFYANVGLCFFLSLISAYFFVRYERAELARRNRWQLMLEFKDAMDSFVSALVAGYSMENAVRETYHDLQLMYGEKRPILEELHDIMHKLTLQQSLDSLFMDLGRRSGVEDIVTFAQIYSTARRSGGNLVKVMKRTADNIGQKVEVQREIRTMIAGKRMESLCMMAVPLLIIVYLQIFSPGFLDPLYHGMAGRIFMTGALIIYGGAVAWSRKIMQIET